MNPETPSHINPSFLILGERKCGTSSLYRYLTSHPGILPCRMKEPQFLTNPEPFIKEYFDEYLKLFPLKNVDEPTYLEWPELNSSEILINQLIEFKRDPHREYISGEASANLLYEGEPAIIKKYLPKIKMVIIMREPASRAWSHFRMFQRFKAEGRKIPIDTGDFSATIEVEMESCEKGRHSEIIGPGIYIQSIRRWVGVFPRKQFRILFTSDLDRPDAPELMNDLTQWLGLEKHNFADITSKKFNRARHTPIPEGDYMRLRRFYEPYDAQLQEYLQRPVPWLNGNYNV